MAKTTSSTKSSKPAKFNPLKTGSDPRTMAPDERSKTSWLKIEPNTYEDVVCLVNAEDIISCEQCAIWLEEGNSPVWVYTGADDPSHDLNVERRYRAFLPVLQDGEAMVWPMGKQAHTQLMELADGGTELKGTKLRLKRVGNGLKTRYTVVPRPGRMDVEDVAEVDVISMLGPLDAEGARELICSRLEIEDYDEVIRTYRGKATKAKPGASTRTIAPTRGKHVKPEDEEETTEEEEEDIRLV
jgi:hypothetical protein